MADMRALYQEVIMDHNKKPRNYGLLNPCTHHADGHNPLCGDHIKLTLNISGDKVDDLQMAQASPSKPMLSTLSPLMFKVSLMWSPHNGL